MSESDSDDNQQSPPSRESKIGTEMTPERRNVILMLKERLDARRGSKKPAKGT